MEQLAGDFAAGGIRALLLRGPGLCGTASARPGEEVGLELLVAAGDADRARGVLDNYDWSYQVGGHGVRGPLPMAVYSWSRTPYLWRKAPFVELRWAVVAPPLPASALRELERSLWRDAVEHRHAFAQPAPEALAVYLAVQASRGGSQREVRLPHLADCLTLASWESVEQLARRCRLRAALNQAGDAARSPRRGGGRYPAPPPTDRPALRLGWRMASFLGARVYPRRLRSRITGAVGFGAAPARCRFGGVEVRVGPGVFAPEIPSERLVRLVMGVISDRVDPIVVEPGTGSGAISLAIAAAHPGANVHAVERYGRPLRWARRNARRLGQTRVHVHRGSLLDPLPDRLAGRVAVIVANLPYVPSVVWSRRDQFVRRAVRGQGDDGLGLYRQLVRQARRFLEPGGHLILEMGPYQVDAFRREIRALGYSIASVEPEILGAVVVTVRLGDSRIGPPDDGPVAVPGA